jgi:AraC-like DNA-binding protein
MKRTVISTDDIAENERFSYYREELGPMIGVGSKLMSDSETPAFKARVTAWSSECLIRFHLAVDPCIVSRGRHEIKEKSWHDWVWIYQETGAGAHFDQAGQELLTRPKDLILAAPDDIAFETQPQGRNGFGQNLWFLPRALIAPHLPSGRLPLWLHLRGHAGMADLVISYLDALARQIDNFADGEMDVVVDNLCRLIAIACGGAMGEQGVAVHAALLEQAKRFVNLHLPDPGLTPARVANVLKISVRQLHLLFEPGSVSFAQHVLARRLEECPAPLTSPHSETRLISEIAFAWGFNSLPTFYRTRGKFRGERRWIYAGAGRMRLARGGIFGLGCRGGRR